MEDEVISLKEKKEELLEKNVDDATTLRVLNNEYQEEKKKVELANGKLHNIENDYEHQKEKYLSENAQNSCLQTRSEEVERACCEIRADIQRKNDEISSTDAELRH